MNWLSNAWGSTKNWLSNSYNSAKSWLTGGQNSQNQAQDTVDNTINNGGGFNIADVLNSVNNNINRNSSSSYRPKAVPEYTKTFADYWNEGSARESATNEYNPYYDKKQQQLQENTDIQKARAEQDFSIGSKLEQDSMDRFLEQAGITEGRAKEDTKIALAQLAAEKGETRAETSYDRIRQNRGLLQELQSRGMVFGGAAKQAGGDQAQGRQLVENKLTRQWGDAESATKLGEARTMEDVGLSKKGRTAESEAKQAQLGLNKTRTIEDLNRSFADEKSSLDEERKYKIEQAVNERWSQAYNSWDLDFKQFMAKYGLM